METVTAAEEHARFVAFAAWCGFAAGRAGFQIRIGLGGRSEIRSLGLNGVLLYHAFITCPV